MGLSWIPALIRSRHAFLSTLCIASAHLDAINNRPTESIQTIALRQEVIHLISQSLLNPHTRIDDFTIIALVQLICSEVVAGNETALHYHEDGMEKMVKQRGGLKELGVGGELASVLTSVSFQSAIFRGTQPKPIYLNYCKTLPHHTASRSQPIPESPLFCPRLDFETIKNSTRCAKHTLDLLTAVRDMTDLFLDNGSTISTAQKDQQLNLLCQHILSLPSSTHYSRASNPAYGDWTYEACRIAAVIQAIAITKRIPLSQACVVAAKRQAPPPGILRLPLLLRILFLFLLPPPCSTPPLPRRLRLPHPIPSRRPAPAAIVPASRPPRRPRPLRPLQLLGRHGRRAVLGRADRRRGGTSRCGGTPRRLAAAEVARGHVGALLDYAVVWAWRCGCWCGAEAAEGYGEDLRWRLGGRLRWGGRGGLMRGLRGWELRGGWGWGEELEIGGKGRG
jgi:hypothetical protein